MVRHKNRYIVAEINPHQNTEGSLTLKTASLHSTITQKVQQLHGDFGVAAVRSGFQARYCNEKTRIAVIKSRHGPHKLVASALPFVNTLESKRCVINTLYTGATIKQCFRFLRKYQQDKYDQFCATLKTDEEKAAMREALLNFDKIKEMH